MPPKAQPTTKPKPALDLTKAAMMNLKVLQRQDPEIEEILGSGGHVALYDFDTKASSWVKKDVEGTVFVVKRRTQPRFELFLLNKKDDDNYVQAIADGFSFSLNKPYLFFRSLTEEVIGMWFYDEPQADVIDGLLKKIVATFPSTRTRGVPVSNEGAGASDMAGFCGWKATVATQENSDAVANGAAVSPSTPPEAPSPTPPPASRNQLEMLLGIRGPPAGPAGAPARGPDHLASHPLPLQSPARAQAAAQNAPNALILAPEQFQTPAAQNATAQSGPQGPSGNLLQQLLAVQSGDSPMPRSNAPNSQQSAAPQGGHLNEQQYKVRQLLQRLAANDAFVALLTNEMQGLGML